MRIFDYFELKNKQWDSEILGYISQIYAEKGKQELYLKQKPSELKDLVESAKRQSTEASNEIEGIRTTSTRLKQIMTEKSAPKNRNESEIAGYRDALKVIHESYDVIPITRNITRASKFGYGRKIQKHTKLYKCNRRQRYVVYVVYTSFSV